MQIAIYHKLKLDDILCGTVAVGTNMSKAAHKRSRTRVLTQINHDLGKDICTRYQKLDGQAEFA